MQECYWQFLFWEMNFGGIAGKIGNMAIGNNFGGVTFQRSLESLAGSLVTRLSAPFQNVEEEQHLLLPVFWHGSFHGVWTSRISHGFRAALSGKLARKRRL